ncbi:Cell division protein FtsQ [Corynebacterium kutscheri]|uniref:Cell division protein FtsQ n=1 Tax=Corynebacterium kutscheri TaxID=35755 RepID=A0A0F6R2C2_9CORY|nr:FtsQ-type POTRA domain-containing protein [Corynebacterium kutscheri]AKE41558.1 cell division septal protein [Corynebacterium kutscheri]VEH08837.1 Cell division protein FtsQ [Corynebacterium kutscheri]VEH09882.1 Cell division protein FtsQ [Corynebacterium kutscheri]VEH79966.1 Cell division protein FtsQ [Corynebacterium kutscheri]
MKKRIFLGLGATMIVALIFFVTAWFYPLWKMSAFEISGQNHTLVEEVETASGVSIGENFFHVDSIAVAKSISALPWVSSVNVNKHIDGVLSIELTEHTVRLYTETADGDVLIDEQGRPFLTAARESGMVKVSGNEQDTPEIYRVVLAALEAMDPMVSARIVEVAAPSSYELTMILDDGRRVYWGSEENLNDKAIALRVALTRGEQSLDVSAAPVIAVR